MPVGRPGLPRLPMLMVAAWLTVGVAGCSPHESRKPRVADSTLVSALADLHLGRARQELGYGVSPGMRDSVLESHGITASQYRRIVSYYTEHPAEYSDLYRRVLDRLTTEQGRSRRSLPGIMPDSSMTQRSAD